MSKIFIFIFVYIGQNWGKAPCVEVLQLETSVLSLLVFIFLIFQEKLW